MNNLKIEYGNFISEIKEIKLDDKSVQLASLCPSDQSRFVGMELAVNEDCDEFIIAALTDCNDLPQTLIKYLKSCKQEDAILLATTIKETIIKYRTDAVNEIIEEVNEHCCGDCARESEDGCDCEIGDCYSCREADYDEIDFDDAA